MHLRTIVSLLICMSLGSPVYSEIFVYVWRQSFLDLGEAVQNPNVSNSWRDETGKKKCFNFTHRYKSLTEKAMAPHSSILARRTPWTEEPGGLQSMGSLRVRH